jgi:hypothetical protein
MVYNSSASDPGKPCPGKYGEKMEVRGRIQEIDIAKGMACLLMVAAHLISKKILPFGTLAAPLFFAYSGMNTILLIERTKGKKCFDVFHAIFPVILFFGGISHIVITKIGPLHVGMKLLQFIAVAVFLLFLLSKFFRDPRRCGILFPVPFIVQQLLPLISLGTSRALPVEFLFNDEYPLFPWFGFFLFGVFLLGLKQKNHRWLLAALLVASVLSYGIAGVPVQRFGMSFSYIFLGLSAITAALSLARWIAGQSGRIFLKWLSGFFSLPGRNALMFLYLHLVVMRFFLTVNFLPSLILYFACETLFLYFACWVFLLFYERVKNETVLFFPALTLVLFLAFLRWAGLLSRPNSLYIVDMVVGVLFAFLYVQLRRRFAAFCDLRDKARA